VTNQFFKFDFKFRALSDPRVDKRMRMRSHMKMTTRVLSSAELRNFRAVPSPLNHVQVELDTQTNRREIRKSNHAGVSKVNSRHGAW